MTEQANKQAGKSEIKALPEEQQVVDYLMSNPEFFLGHAPLLHDLQIPHESGAASRIAPCASRPIGGRV